MKLRWTEVLAAVAAASALACAPSSDDGGSGGNDSDGGAGTLDAHPGAAHDGAAVPDAPACAAASVQAEESLAPVDIIWAVDSSGSMNDEEAAVQDALNDFSAFIAASGIDYRVILIGDAGSMNVPPPLGGSPEFLHVDRSIGSHDALELIVDTFPSYQAFRRPDAVVHIVVVTDDESDWSQGTFEGALAGLPAPGIPADYTFHSVCSEENVLYTPPPPLPPILGPCIGGLGVGGAAGIGQTYMDMVGDTGGVWRSICTTDWAPIFTAVAEAVSVGVALPCTYDIPAPPEGETLDPDRVNFIYTPTGGSPVTVPRVDDEASCAGGQGWYYDDPVAPTQIQLCPATCTVLGADTEGQVDIELGCATIVL